MKMRATTGRWLLLLFLAAAGCAPSRLQIGVGQGERMIDGRERRDRVVWVRLSWERRR
jgi:hypothetical protein